MDRHGVEQMLKSCWQSYLEIILRPEWKCDSCLEMDRYSSCTDKRHLLFGAEQVMPTIDIIQVTQVIYSNPFGVMMLAQSRLLQTQATIQTIAIQCLLLLLNKVQLSIQTMAIYFLLLHIHLQKRGSIQDSADKNAT